MKKVKVIDSSLKAAEHILNGDINSNNYFDIEKALKYEAFDLNHSLYSNLKLLSTSSDITQEQLIYIRMLGTENSYSPDSLFFTPIIKILFSNTRFFNQNKILGLAGEKIDFNGEIITSILNEILKKINDNFRNKYMVINDADKLYNFLLSLENRGIQIPKYTNDIIKHLIYGLHIGVFNDEAAQSLRRLITVLYKNNYVDADNEVEYTVMFITDLLFNNNYRKAITVMKSVNENDKIIIGLIDMIYGTYMILKDFKSIKLIKSSFIKFLKSLITMSQNRKNIDVEKINRILNHMEKSKQKELQ